MKNALSTALIASLLAGSALLAQAQPTEGCMPGGAHAMPGHDADAMHARHLEHLKGRLHLGADQEAAWNTFAAAMQPVARPERPKDMAELRGLSTPERLDRMRALRQQRMQDMERIAEQRDQAVKNFYAVLNPEQKKTFDEAHRRFGEGMEHRGMMRHDAAPAGKP